jgi:hypothetical protein
VGGVCAALLCLQDCTLLLVIAVCWVVGRLLISDPTHLLIAFIKLCSSRWKPLYAAVAAVAVAAAASDGSIHSEMFPQRLPCIIRTAGFRSVLYMFCLQLLPLWFEAGLNVLPAILLAARATQLGSHVVTLPPVYSSMDRGARGLWTCRTVCWLPCNSVL